jgi:general secretion pathway protein A
MYAPYFGLSKEPFSIAPDPRFLFMSEQHREALAHLLYGLGGGGGFVLLTGEVGAGKTTVCRCFLEQVPAHCAVAYVFNPKLTAVELLQTVNHEFGIAPPADAASLKAHVDALNAFLLDAHAAGRQAVLVIDEAQALSADVLEQLRLLTNLETAERKLLQIVLIGQPELRTMLARPDLEQLAQRVIARYHLGPLNAAETAAYVRHRWAVAGPAAAALPFEPAALARIHARSGGVPRRINLLADRALLGAYAQGLQKVDVRTVDKAAGEVFFGAAAQPQAALQRRWAAAAALGLGGVAVLALAWQGWPGGRGGQGASVAATAPAPAAAGSDAGPTGAPRPAALGAGSSPPLTSAHAGTGAAASAAAGATPPATVLDDPGPLLAAAHADVATAWRELALHWHVAIGEGDPCVAARQAQLACFRAPAGAGLPAVQALARPGVVALRDGSGGASTVHALLLGVHEGRATLAAGQQRFVLALPALAAVWRGDFATFWRTPPGWRGDGDDAAAWVERQLDDGVGGPAAAGAATRPLRERIRAFQLAQGLPADGVAGPMTLMRLNRATGIDEPRLEGPR